VNSARRNHSPLRPHEDSFVTAWDLRSLFQRMCTSQRRARVLGRPHLRASWVNCTANQSPAFRGWGHSTLLWRIMASDEREARERLEEGGISPAADSPGRKLVRCKISPPDQGRNKRLRRLTLPPQDETFSVASKMDFGGAREIFKRGVYIRRYPACQPFGRSVFVDCCTGADPRAISQRASVGPRAAECPTLYRSNKRKTFAPR
jgi:hypothetical protein